MPPPTKRTNPVLIGCLASCGGCGLLLVLFAVIGALGASKTIRNDVSSVEVDTPAVAAKTVKEKPAAKEKPELELLESHQEKGDFISYVAGTIKNNNDHKVSYVQIEINLYDKSGAQVGSTMANIANLDAQGTWKFKAMVTEKTARSYKIKGITAF